MTNLFSPIKFLFVIFLSWACFHFVATADSASEFFKLIPSDSNALDEFGQSVAISGNLMAIGSPNEDSGGTNMGAAYIYELFGNTWVFQTKIVPADGQAGDTFGTAISMSSNLLLVGSKSHDINGVSNVGAAYVYANTSGNVWEEQAMLSSFDGLVGDAFGSAVAIDGNVAVVAASYHDVSGFSNSGAAYVFANSSANNWVFQSKIYSSSPRTNAYFGESVSVSGNRVAVGAYKDSLANSSAGSVYIYENSSSNIWLEQAILHASDITSNDQFGHDISLSGNVILIGSSGDDVEGAAYIFVHQSGNIWAEQAKLEPASGFQGDDFGTSVSLSGNIALIGAPNNDELGTNTGSAHVFVNTTGSIWVEQEKLVAGDGETSDSFGNSLALNGSILVIGASLDNNSQGDDSGAVYTFDLNNLSHAPVISPWPKLDVTFALGQSSISLSSGNLSAVDRDGDILAWSVFKNPSHGNISTFNTSSNNIDSLVYDSHFPNGVGDSFILEVNDGQFSRFVTVSVGREFSEFQDIPANDALSNMEYGAAVDTDGYFLIVGSPKEDSIATDSGAAYIYTRSGNSWVLQSKLKASDAEASDSFGYSVSISGNQAIVGAYLEDTHGSSAGAAYVYVNTSANVWVEQAKLVSDQPAANFQFGKAVSISGNIALVGSDQDGIAGSSAGAVFVFTNTNGNSWDFQRRLIAADAASYDRYGNAVEINGKLAIVGSFLENFGDGAAYIFEHTGGNNWIEHASLKPTDIVANDRFGTSVSISGNLAIVGSPLVDDAATDGGAVYFYVNHSGTSWVQQAKLTASDAENLDNFGESVSISGSMALVGAKNKSSYTGSAYLFKHVSGNVWVEDVRLNHPSSQTSDYFGKAVSLSGNLAIIGAIYNDSYASNAGLTYHAELGPVSPYRPTMESSKFSVEENTLLNLNTSDISAQSFYGTPLQWSLSANATNGSVTNLSMSGNDIISLDYVPNANFFGDDTFTLRVDDLVAGSYAEVVIVVHVNPAPPSLPMLSRQSAGARLVSMKDGSDFLVGGVNQFGQIGLAFTSANIEGLSYLNFGVQPTQVALGAEHGVALDVNGSIWTWGNNQYGQLGHGDQALRSSPAMVFALSNVVRVYAGAYTSYAITNSGELFAWGRNNEGQLGIDTVGDQDSPQQVVLPGDIEDLSVGVDHALAVVDGALYTWGSDGFCQLGDGLQEKSLADRDQPILIDNTLSWERVVAGGFHSHAWTSTNTLYAWGKNDRGQLGVGHFDPVCSANTDIVSFAEIKSMASGYEHSLFLKTDGQVWATGSNLHGQTTSANVTINVPIQVMGIAPSSENEISSGPFSSWYSTEFDIYVWGRQPNGNVTPMEQYYSNSR